MTLKSVIARTIVPQRMYRILERERNKRDLNRIPSMSFARTDTKRLLNVGELEISKVFSDAGQTSQWQDSCERLRGVSISAAAGGVNPGDRRALFQLIRKLKPCRVLEIGTHIGASTVCMADAMQGYSHEHSGEEIELVTVDIIDVNNEVERPWEHAGEIDSPIRKLSQLSLEKFVTFVAKPSLTYLSDTDMVFDLIFLDGDHSASTVYKELPVAIQRLNAGGCIVLHDFFPGGRPLWSNGAVVSGPYLAVERLLNEGLNITVRPLGELPWECKLGSNVTSLALVGH